MASNIDRLIEVMARLRNPNGGCPWDIEQNFASIAPYTIEETYELVEAIENDDAQSIKEELGDLFFQVVFHAQMAKEAGWFDIDEVAGYVADKMIERHPHVFSSRNAKTSGDVLVNWEADKAAKRKQKAEAEGRAESALDGVSAALPAATRAVKLQNRAARVGFDWAEARDVLAKIREEIGELEEEMNKGAVAVAGSEPPPKADERTAEQSRPLKDFLEDELGDVLFAVANLARKLDIDPETALRRTNKKFERRFRGIEETLAQQGRTMQNASLDEMEAIWKEIKAREKKAS